MNTKINLMKLILPIFLVAISLMLGTSVLAVWSGPLGLPPNGNIAPPLSRDTIFLGDISGTYNNLKIQISNCTSTDRFLMWNGSDLICGNAETVVNLINNYYSSSGGGGTIISGTSTNTATAGLAQVLNNSANAKGYAGNVFIGDLSSSSVASFDLGGPLTAKWVHSSSEGDNKFAGNILTSGNVGIGTKNNPGLSLQMEKKDETVNLAGKYWSVNYDYPGKELFNILAKVGTVDSTNWPDSVAGKISFVGVSNNHIPLTDIVFSTTRNLNEAPVEQMRIKADGNVVADRFSANSLLVGDANAYWKTEIKNIAGLGSLPILSGRLTVNLDGESLSINRGTIANGIYLIADSGVNETAISFVSLDDLTKTLDVVYGDGALNFSTNGNSRMFLAGNGYIGIGTNSPTANLDVLVDGGPAANLGGWATGNRAVAMIGGAGNGSQAKGDYSFSAGASSIADGTGAVALGGIWGDGNNAIGNGTFVAGGNAKANGEGTIALGMASATGVRSFALNGNLVGDTSIVIGQLVGSGSSVQGAGSILIGVGTVIKDNVTVITSPSNLVGINNTNPVESLDVTGSIKASGVYKVGNQTGLTKNITIKGSDGNNCQLNIVGGIIVSTTCN